MAQSISFGRRRSPRASTARRGGGRRMVQLGIAILIAVVSIISYYGTKQTNPITGEVQHVRLTADEEIVLGLQAAPQMASEFGGLHPSGQLQERIDHIGQRLVQNSDASRSEYPFEFHALADDQTINAFALPGGQIFITAGLLRHLDSDAEIAGVLGHEIGHVIGRHGAEHMAKAELTQGLTAAAVVAATNPDDPNSGRASGAMAAYVGQMINLRYGREDELESDRFGVRFMAQSGYDPRGMLRVMEVLRDTAGPNRQPEFMSSHPDPGNRLEKIAEAIQAEFPNGVPAGLEQ